MEKRTEDAYGGRRLADLVGDATLDRVLRNANAVLAALDDDGRVVRAAPTRTTVLALDTLLAGQLPFPSESFAPPERVASIVAAALAGGSPDPCFATREDAAGHRSLWRVEAFAPEPGAQGEGGGAMVLLVSLDRAEARGVLDSALQSATLGERIERERVAAAQAVIVTIRHEINNALTSLIGYGDLMLRRSDVLDAATGDRVREMLEQAHRIRMVLDRIEGLVQIRTASYLEGVPMVDLGDAPPEGGER